LSRLRARRGEFSSPDTEYCLYDSEFDEILAPTEVLPTEFYCSEVSPHATEAPQLLLPLAIKSVTQSRAIERIFQTQERIGMAPSLRCRFISYGQASAMTWTKCTRNPALGDIERCTTTSYQTCFAPRVTTGNFVEYAHPFGGRDLTTLEVITVNDARRILEERLDDPWAGNELEEPRKGGVYDENTLLGDGLFAGPDDPDKRVRGEPLGTGADPLARFLLTGVDASIENNSGGPRSTVVSSVKRRTRGRGRGRQRGSREKGGQKNGPPKKPQKRRQANIYIVDYICAREPLHAGLKPPNSYMPKKLSKLYRGLPIQMFYVHWQGYDKKDRTWEPEWNLTDPLPVQAFDSVMRNDSQPSVKGILSMGPEEAEDAIRKMKEYMDNVIGSQAEESYESEGDEDS